MSNIYNGNGTNTPGLNHAQAQALIDRLDQDPLTETERQALNAHLAGCKTCVAFLHEINGLDRQLSKSLPERWPEVRYAPVAIEARRLAIRAGARRAVQLRSLWSIGGLATGAVTLLVFAIGLGWLVSGLSRPQAGNLAPGTVGQTPAQATAQAVAFGAATIDPTLLPNGSGPTAVGTVIQQMLATLPYDAANGGNNLVTTPIPGQENMQPQPVGTQPAGSSANQSLPTPTIDGRSAFSMNGVATAAVGQRVSLAEAEMRVRESIFSETPNMNPDATFPVVDITPAEVWKRLGGQVFKIVDGVRANDSYFIRAGRAVWLGTSFGGTGVGDMQVTDLDGDGSPEMLYTRDFGSGRSLSTLGIVYGDGESIGVVDASGLMYEGSLALEKVSDQTVRVSGKPPSYSPPAPAAVLGVASWSDGLLLLVPGDRDLSTYTSSRYGVSFQYPRTWQPAGDETYLEGRGFFQLAYYTPDGMSLTRACQVEANGNADRYGYLPLILTAQDGERMRCLILPNNSDGQQGLILFPAPDGKLAFLRADAAHITLLWTTFTFTMPASGSAQATAQPPSGPINTGVQTRQIDNLTLNEWAVASATEVDMPDLGFDSRIPAEVLAAREQAQAGDLIAANGLLAPYGWRLEAEGYNYRLYQGSTLIKDGLRSFRMPAVYHDQSGVADFAMLVISVESGREHSYLVRSNGLSDYDLGLHRNTAPVFAADGLISVESEQPGFGLVRVNQDEQAIYDYRALGWASDPVKGLTAWNGQWVLEVDGVLIVNGTILNQKEGYSDAFNARTLNGQPFYFYERDGKIGLMYNGQPLPVTYDAVMHNGCCSAGAVNVRNYAGSLWFYAKRDGIWHLVELAAK